MKIVENPTDDDIMLISDGLRTYNDSIGGPDNHSPYNLIVRNDNDEFIAGIIAGTYWGWLYVDILFVDESCRKGGIGKMLLEKVENEARKRGCHHVHLETMSWQALGFYEKHGYKKVYTFKDLPKGHDKYLLIKEL